MTGLDRSLVSQYGACTDSFEGQVSDEDTPILFGPAEMPELKVDLTTTEPRSPEGELAFSTLVGATDAVATDLALNPGNLLIFDNRRWLHGRGTTIAPSSDRWLLRSLFVYDSWRMQSSDGEGGQSELVVYG
jgi:L-asparagine oxygenase